MYVYVVIHCQPPEEKAVRLFRDKRDAERLANGLNNRLSDTERLQESYYVKEYPVW